MIFNNEKISLSLSIVTIKEIAMGKIKLRWLLVIIFILFSVFVWGVQDARNSDQDVFAQRRQQLMEKMDGGIAILRSAEDTSDFYYLTGLDEPNTAILLIPGEKEKYIIFIQPTSPVRELWTGKHPGLEEAERVFGADKAYPVSEFEKVLNRYLRGKSRIYLSFNDKELYDKIMPMVRSPYDSEPKQIIDPRLYIHEMRLVKDEKEIELMRKAADITCEALIEVMKAVQPGMYEHEIEAVIEYIFRKNGALGPGFPSIIGSGPNATILHYDSNNRQSQDGELVLMDVGAEYGHYMSDVTRTIPVNGRFTQTQREIYEVVLQSQKEAIKIAAPGVGIYEINTRGVEVIKEGLLKLGLITDKDSDWQHRLWLMYNISHWVGLDVHDVGGRGPDDGKGCRFAPGMVFTVEPGLYIREETLENLPGMIGRSKVEKEELEDFISKVRPAVAKYANIGVRIEDDILVTKTGYEVISSRAPKEIEAIEKLMKKKSSFK
jgi:Xaa-Pro aminopeptidase